MASESAILDVLLAGRSREFFERHYLKMPFCSAGGCETLRDYDRSAAERLALESSADVLIGRGGTRWEGDRPASRDQLHELVDAGYTIGVRHAQRHDGGLQELADSFRRSLGGAVDIHLYWTPAGQPGFGWHYDAEEVFILQTQGEKCWWLRKNTVNPWPLMEAIPANQDYRREIMPALECRLVAGDWLYIPAGYWHRTEAGAESVSLSVGVQSPAAIDVYDFVRSSLVDSLRWRQRLPLVGPTASIDVIDELRRLFADLGSDLAAIFEREETLQAFLRSRRADANR